MLIADVISEEARHGSEGAWVGMRLEECAVEGKLAGIEAKTGPRLPQSELEIVFAGNEVDRAGASFVVDNQVEERIERSFPLRRGDLGERLTVKFFQAGINDS